MCFVQNEEPVGDNTVPVNRPPSKQKQMTPQVGDNSSLLKGESHRTIRKLYTVDISYDHIQV